MGPSFDARDQLARLIADPPAGERTLLELVPVWEGLEGTPARVAARLRLFALSWDPLAWLPDRASVWATANGDGDLWELVVYATLTGLTDRGDPTAAFDELAETAVLAGSGQEQLLASGAYPQLAARGRAPGLLERPVGSAALGQPLLSAPAGAWEPIGLGAIQDLVQAVFGPVDLDRAAVRLAVGGPRRPGCPACANGRLGFPGELAEAAPLMCPRHRKKAEALISRRLDRAQASNPKGWDAIARASARLHDLPDPSERSAGEL